MLDDIFKNVTVAYIMLVLLIASFLVLTVMQVVDTRNESTQLVGQTISSEESDD